MTAKLYIAVHMTMCGGNAEAVVKTIRTPKAVRSNAKKYGSSSKEFGSSAKECEGVQGVMKQENKF